MLDISTEVWYFVYGNVDGKKNDETKIYLCIDEGYPQCFTTKFGKPLPYEPKSTKNWHGMPNNYDVKHREIFREIITKTTKTEITIESVTNCQI